MRRFAAVDLRRPVESTLFRLLSINFLLVALLCSVWFAGIAGALIYSFVLFFHSAVGLRACRKLQCRAKAHA